MDRARQVWLLADSEGASLAELTTAAGKTLDRVRNRYHEAQFTLSHHDEAASLLLNAVTSTGMPTLRIYRFSPATPGEGVLIFNGHLAPFSEQAEEDATLAPVFRSPFARLLGDGSGRGRFTGATFTRTARDAGLIARDLIDLVNFDGYTGLSTSGAIATAPTTDPGTGATLYPPGFRARDKTYAYANIGEAVQRFTELQDGFDFYEDFIEGGQTLATFNVVARQGVERSASFEYGPGTLSNVRSMSRQTQPPINVARVLGGTGLAGLRVDENSRAKYGDWPVQVSASDVKEQKVLDEKAQALLRPEPVKTVEFTPEYALPSCPQPFDDFDLGDRVGFYARRAALEEKVRVRINGMRVVVDNNGFEATEIQDPTTPHEEMTIRAALEVEVRPDE